VAADSLLFLLKDLSRVDVSMNPGVPSDAKVVAMERGDFLPKHSYNTMYIVISSHTFDPVPEGELIPDLKLIYTTTQRTKSDRTF
jgi:molybdopterin-biosynthesis enzyme MoeA-like protein